MIIGDLEVIIFTDSKRVKLSKRYNDVSTDTIDQLGESDIYALEFAVKEIKRILELK